MTKLAVIDIGTNSIHMVLAEIEGRTSIHSLPPLIFWGRNMARKSKAHDTDGWWIRLMALDRS